MSSNPMGFQLKSVHNCTIAKTEFYIYYLLLVSKTL